MFFHWTILLCIISAQSLVASQSANDVYVFTGGNIRRTTTIDFRDYLDTPKEAIHATSIVAPASSTLTSTFRSVRARLKKIRLKNR